MAVPVVGRAFLRIAQHAIGFRCLLELVFGVRVFGVAVGVVQQRQLAVGGLDLLLAGVPAHAENLVVVSFRHGIHRVTA